MDEQDIWLIHQTSREKICISCNAPTSLAQLQKTVKLQFGTSLGQGLDLKMGGIWNG
jgi:hypothetical protein